MRLAIGSASLVALLSNACDKPAPPSPATTASAAPSAPAVAPKPSAEVGKSESKNAAAGRWTGSYEAQHYQIEAPKNEGAREWAADDGGAHSGRGTLSLSVSDSGTVAGTATGSLGEHDVVGEVDGDRFRVRFSPKKPGDRAFTGFAILSREGEAMKGRLQASTGDSKTVRDALISVSRGEAKAEAPEPAPSTSPSAAASSG